MIHLQLWTPAAASVEEVSTLINLIWPKPYAAPALQASVADGIDEPTGQVFLIMYTATGMQPRVIGITGYFDIDSHKGTAYLRWTGISPAFRREGHFRETIRLLTLQLRGANPAINKLIELIPDSDYGSFVVGPAFDRVGFVAEPDLTVPDGEDADWPVIPFALYF